MEGAKGADAMPPSSCVDAQVIGLCDVRTRAVLAYAAATGVAQVYRGKDALPFLPSPTPEDSEHGFAIQFSLAADFSALVKKSWMWWLGPQGAALRDRIGDDRLGPQPRQTNIGSFFKAMVRGVAAARASRPPNTPLRISVASRLSTKTCNAAPQGEGTRQRVVPEPAWWPWPCAREAKLV